MKIEKNNSVRTFAAPIRVSNLSTGQRMRASRDASHDYANKVMTKILCKSGLPPELISEATDWLMVIDRATRGAAKSVIGQLGADFDLGEDHALVLETEALSQLQATIETCGFSTAAQAQLRGWDWVPYSCNVKATLRKTHAEISAELSPQLEEAIGKLIDALERGLSDEDWDVCRETMAKLNRVVSTGWLESPEPSPRGPEDTEAERVRVDNSDAIRRVQSRGGAAAAEIVAVMKEKNMTADGAALRLLRDCINARRSKLAKFSDKEIREKRVDQLKVAVRAFQPHLNHELLLRLNRWIADLSRSANEEDLSAFCDKLNKSPLDREPGSFSFAPM